MALIQGSTTCSRETPNQRSLKAFLGERTNVLGESAAITAGDAQVTERLDEQAVIVLDAGIYATASFVILLISGVAARKLFITSGLKSASDHGVGAVEKNAVKIKGAYGDDGLDNFRKRKA